jgi:hypothetical protein
VQPLEHHRGAVAELLDRLAAVDEPGQLAAGEGGAAGVALLGQDRPVADQPDARRPDRVRGEQPVGVLQGEVRRQLVRVDPVVVDP